MRDQEHSATARDPARPNCFLDLARVRRGRAEAAGDFKVNVPSRADVGPLCPPVTPDRLECRVEVVRRKASRASYLLYADYMDRPVGHGYVILKVAIESQSVRSTFGQTTRKDDLFHAILVFVRNT